MERVDGTETGFRVRKHIQWKDLCRDARTRPRTRVPSPAVLPVAAERKSLVAACSSASPQGRARCPRLDIQRRFLPSLRNFFTLYLPLADEALLYDAAGNPPRLVARWQLQFYEVVNSQAYERIQSQVKTS